MSRKSFSTLLGQAALGASLALTLADLSAQAALPGPINPNPRHQSVDIASSPTLTWNRDRVNLLVNGNFESGELNGWQNQTLQGFGGMEIDDGTFNPNGPDGPTPPLEGSFCATLQSLNFGGGGFYEFSQLVTIPSGLTDVRFSWSHLIRNYANAFSNDGQFQYYRVEVRNEAGNVLETLYSTQPGDVLFDDLDNVDIVAYFDWKKEVANFDAYVGQSVRIVFSTRSQQGNLNVRLDRMSLTARPLDPITNEVFLSLNPLPGPGDRLGTTTENVWPLSNLQPNTTYYWRVNGRQGAEVSTGPVWQFRTGPVGSVDQFIWDTPASASEGVPFTGTVAARDTRNNPVTGVTGMGNLSAVSLDLSTSYHLLQNQTFSSLNSFERTTAGYSFTPSADIWVQTVRALAGDKISIWTSDGLLLASAPLSGPNGIWKEAILETPLSLLAGRTYRIGVYAENLTSFFNRFDASASFPHGTIHQGYVGPGDAFPTQAHSAQWWMVDLGYVVAGSNQPAISPSTTGVFISGAWSDSITVDQASGSVALLVEFSNGTKGYSDPISFGSGPDAFRIDSIAADGGQLLIEFTAKANQSYSVLYRESAGEGAWNKLEDVESGETDRTVTIADSAPITGTRFYQLVTPKQ